MTAHFTPETQQNFLAAMQHVYGPFTHLSPSSASTWTPPPNSEGHRGRYLWTDAFAVINFLTLHKSTSNPLYLTLAAHLIQNVHDILGYSRDGTKRLDGATDAEPLKGGLRIGKMEESGPDGDGQYFHYLTIWMFALNRMSLASGTKTYNDLALQLAKTVHPRFMVNRHSQRPRMFWKMSMDLSHPLVRSEGNLDPIDGYVIYKLLQQTDGEGSTVLVEEICDYKKILETKWRGYSSDDSLDLGMTLWTSHWFEGEEEWATGLSQRASRDLGKLNSEGYFDLPTAYRLAFREFGTCLGIRVRDTATELQPIFEALARKLTTTWETKNVVPVPAGGTIEVREKLVPITCVMHATALFPGAFQKDFFCH
ncbi:hypothetical protein JAAARDRAFT_57340 [Jaapia argillacea MUCL 33604]|uniref:Uncharacterized protein n=1 Tax=Jaapia argillacea MUCL 33604 TaxID=933084 RepID=A0A067PUB1_9AGAM|nr:hypothetical protein JAAARDRAFT_57340 [Jaapia argillacea MUCL 33604]